MRKLTFKKGYTCIEPKPGTGKEHRIVVGLFYFLSRVVLITGLSFIIAVSTLYTFLFM